MDHAYTLLVKISRWLTIIAASALTFMMLLTVADVIGRTFGHAVLGTYEIVSTLLGVVIGFCLPKVTIERGHVSMEFLLDKVSSKTRAAINTVTRLICLILFMFIAYNLVSVGNEFHRVGEVTPILQIPFFPVAYGISVCCVIECFIFFFDIVKVWRGQYE